MRILLIGLLFISSLLSLQAQPKEEIRATWLTTLGGMDWPTRKANSAKGIEAQKNELIRQLDALKAANFNTVLFQTRLRGDVIYPSAIETFAESLTGHTGKNPGYDPLQFAIEECHKRGLELHAWLVCIPIGNKRQVTLLGKNCVVKKQPALCKQFNGSWYLDPGNPGTADYLSRIAKEITSRYDIDGIHLDYIRYPEQGEKFPDKDTYRKYGKKQELKQWRRDNITRIVARIYAEVKQLKPWVKVSSSPIGKFNDTRRYSSFGWNAYSTVYQDAQKWLNDGIQDALFPMMYFLGDNFYPFLYDWKEGAGGRPVVPGLGIYFLDPREGRWSLSDVRQEMHAVRDAGIGGIALYRSDFFTRNCKGLYDMASVSFFSRPALTPRMVWRGDTVSPASTNGLNLSSSGVLSWNRSNETEDVFYNVYSSWHYPVDVADGRNLCAARLQGISFEVPELGLYYAVTVMDRYGNESEPCQLPSSCVAFSSVSATYKIESDTVRFKPDPQALCVYVKDLPGKTVRVALDDDFVVVSSLSPGWYKLVKVLKSGKSEPMGIFMK